MRYTKADAKTSTMDLFKNIKESGDMTKKTCTNRAWFIADDGRAPRTLYVMYDNTINPSSTVFMQGLVDDLSGFKYDLSPFYDAKKVGIDYLYKVTDQIVKFHAANTDAKEDSELKSWHITCQVLSAIEKQHESITLIKSELGWETDLLQRSTNKDRISSLIFNVEKNKWAVPEHILKWDFLMNSTAIPLVNSKALKVLEEVAHGEFQAIPTEIRLPDGQVITDYKLINVTNLVDGIDFEHSVEDPQYKGTKIELSKFKKIYHKLNCLEVASKLLARNKDIRVTTPYIAEKLRKAIKSANLAGITFKDEYARHKFWHGDK